VKNFLFEKELMVVLGDTDAAGRIYFARPAHWFHAAWEEFLDFKGTPIAKMLDGAFHLPIVNFEMQFKAPLKAGDKVYVIVLGVDIGKRSFAVNYEVVQKEDREKIMVTAKITHACVDMKTGRAMNLPESFSKNLSN
jgi:1,4-dihydroxy-2-naphthoyl-CoA hydrolase